MEFYHPIIIIAGVILCAIFAAPLKWWIDDLRQSSVEKKIIKCKAKIENAREFLEEYPEIEHHYANGTRKPSELTILKKQQIQKGKLKLQLLEHKLNKINPPIILADREL